MQYLNYVLMSAGFNDIKNATTIFFLAFSQWGMESSWSPRLSFAQIDYGRIG